MMDDAVFIFFFTGFVLRFIRPGKIIIPIIILADSILFFILALKAGFGINSFVDILNPAYLINLFSILILLSDWRYKYKIIKTNL